MNVSDARERALGLLTGNDVPSPVRTGTPALDCDLILCHLLGSSRSSLMAHPERELGTAEERFFDAIASRARGVPVAYIVGKREFWGLSFGVTPAVLIPKPDTETLVERAISILSGRGGTPRVLDVCTGSGCVAVSIAHECPSARVMATDISPDALSIARVNAERLVGAGRVGFIEGDLRDGLPLPDDTGGSAWDLVVSNPPYVPTRIVPELLSDGRGEPVLALDGGADGLSLFRPLASNALTVLTAGGVFIAETGEYNAREAARWLEECGYEDILVHADLEGQDRVVEGRKRNG